ncbi:UBP-type zinc finger domain-containing protein [Kitasatospora sp. NPDC048722]|uniref:UBP-type zinc finger domain-containing protein n=1 Tax=Kitasatospora sp. NPDC048722 TaxID=3155639 RepID=UPI0033DEC42E
MSTCSHLDRIDPALTVDESAGCQECLAAGAGWVHLRRCLTCGHVGCCDSSRGRHASRHYRDTGHPLAASHQPGEDWAWCFADRVLLESA